MKKWYAICFSYFLANFALAQHAVTIQIIGDQLRPIVGAKVIFASSSPLFSTTHGQVTFKGIPTGRHSITIQAMGYQVFEDTVKIKDANTFFRAQLKMSINELRNVEVVAHKQDFKKNTDSRSIELVDQQFVQRHLNGSLMKTLERLPGVSSIGIGSGQSKPLIRGLGFNRVVVVDRGIKHEGQQWGADHGLEIDQFATGEIEIVKGPSAFIYGSDAIGGAIDLKPVKIPLNQGIAGNIQLIGKSNNSHYGGSANLYGSNRKWFFNSRFSYHNYADYRVPTDTVDVYDYAVGLHHRQLRNTAGRETGLHLSVGYMGEQLSSSVHLSNSYAKSGFFANAHGLEPRRVDEILHDSSDRDILSPFQHVNHFKFIHHTEFKQQQHKTEVEWGFQRNFRQEYNHYVNHGYMPPIYPPDLSIPQHLERQYDKTVYTANLRHHISLAKHQLQFGTNSDYQINDIEGWSFLIPAFRQFNSGLFIYDKYAVNHHIILHGALRYDYGFIQFERYDDWFTSSQQNGPVTTIEQITRSRRFARDFNSFVWSFGTNYNQGKFLFKVNIGKSFRMPIAKELAANGVNYHYFSYERGNENLNPEVAYQTDMGFTWSEKKWSITLSPFYNYFPNYIYLNPTPYHDYYYGAGNQVFEYTQSKVMRYGAELKVNYQLLTNLSAEILGEYLYSEQLSGDKKGFTLPFSPAPSALLNLTWSPKLSDQLHYSYLSVDYRLTASQNNIVPPEKKTPGYQVVNVQMGTTLNLGKQVFELSLQAQNLLNAKYLNHTSFYRLIELPEASRNIILSIKMPFKIN